MKSRSVREQGAPDVLARLLDFYGLAGDERETVLELGALARARQKRRAYTDLLPGSFQRFADLEASATEINCYEFGIVPGLLQSLGYVRATIDERPRGLVAAIQCRVGGADCLPARPAGKYLNSPEPKTLRFVLTEDVPLAAFDSPEIMREQRRHILKLLESNDNLTVQVLPSKAFGNPARGGGLTILGFGDKGSPVGFSTVVFGPSTYFDQETDTAAPLRGFRRVQELALDPDDSVRLIRQIAKEG